MSGEVSAKVVSASSEGFGALIDLTIVGANINSGVLPAGAIGRTPGAYDETADTLAVSGDLLGLGLINVDIPVLTGSASSNVDNTLGSKLTAATGGVTSLGVSAAGLLELTVGAVNAEAEVQGDFGELTTVAKSAIANLGIDLLGLGSIPINIGTKPNFTVDLLGLLNLAGVNLTLNEQLINGDPNGVCSDDSCSLEVNALHLALSRVPFGINLISGDIKIGHAFAEMAASAVPVPAAVSLFGSGLIGLVGFSRLRRLNIAA
ncbi:MAG: hypothetical protein ACU836_12935 [Gammaproteobacteria bacterium]